MTPLLRGKLNGTTKWWLPAHHSRRIGFSSRATRAGELGSSGWRRALAEDSAVPAAICTDPWGSISAPSSVAQPLPFRARCLPAEGDFAKPQLQGIQVTQGDGAIAVAPSEPPAAGAEGGVTRIGARETVEADLGATIGQTTQSEPDMAQGHFTEQVGLGMRSLGA